MDVWLGEEVGDSTWIIIKKWNGFFDLGALSLQGGCVSTASWEPSPARSACRQVCTLAAMLENLWESSMASYPLGFHHEKTLRHMTSLSLRQLRCLAGDKGCSGGGGTSACTVWPVVSVSNVGTGVGVKGGFCLWDLSLGTLGFFSFLLQGQKRQSVDTSFSKCDLYTDLGYWRGNTKVNSGKVSARKWEFLSFRTSQQML